MLGSVDRLPTLPHRLIVEPGTTDAGGGGEGEKKPDAAATPTFVPTEDFKTFQQQITGTLQGINDALSQLSKTIVPAGKSEVVGDRVKDEEIEEALRTGQGGGVFRRLVKEHVDELRTTEINPLRDEGLAAIGEVVAGSMAKELLYYTRFKKEIDEYVGKMPPGLRIRPEAIRMAHNAVVGAHAAEIVNEAKEAALRGGDTPPKGGGAPPQGNARQAGAGGGTPTVEDLMGKDAADALAFRGLDGDALARRMGYKDWPTYAALAKEQA